MLCIVFQQMFATVVTETAFYASLLQLQPANYQLRWKRLGFFMHDSSSGLGIKSAKQYRTYLDAVIVVLNMGRRVFGRAYLMVGKD